MATVDKNFKVKNGLVVEGTSGTINGSEIITEDILTGGTQTNISVTYDAQSKTVSFTAENGIADSTTDDLAEGATNLYFTDQRAIDAVGGSATDINTPNTVVKRDGNGDFAAGMISADLTGDVTGTVSDISNHDTDDLSEGTTNQYFTNQRALDATAAAYDAAGSAATAEYNAKGYADGLAINYDPAGSAATAESNANSYADGLASNYDPAGSASTAVSSHNDLTTGVHGVTGDVVGTTDTQALSNKTLASDLDADGFTITNIVAPVNPGDAANKLYVDEVAQGLSIKPAVAAATTENLSGTYDNGTSGIDATINLGHLSTLDVDGVTVWEQYDGILVRDQTDPTENGRYYVDQIGSSSVDWILKRCKACDEPDEIPSAYVFVQGGDTYASSGWVAVVENFSSFTIGTDDISWIQFSGAGTYLAGNGLELDGGVFSIDTAVVVDVNTSQTLVNKTIDAASNTLSNIGNASLTNSSVSINGESVSLGGSLTLDTDDVEEGSTNLYFTDSRAVDALEAVTPNFVSVDVNDVARQVAATTLIELAATAEAVYSFAKSEYRSAKFLVKISYGSHTEVSEVLVTLDTSDNVAITEYAIVGTNGSLGTITAIAGASNVDLIVDAANNNSTVNVYGTLLV